MSEQELECPECGNRRASEKTLFRIDTEANEPKEEITARECTWCDTVYYKVNED